jgi:hypothetical protein
MNAHRAAIQFVMDFQIGMTLTPFQFDEWARKYRLLNTPPDIPKQSDAWLAHLQRRHQLRYNINKEALRLESPYIIEAVGGKVWEVRTPATAISKNRIAHRVQTLTVTKRRQLRRLMASADWSMLPPHERTVAEALSDDIDLFAGATKYHAEALETKFIKLQLKLKHAVESGDVYPVNDGLKQLIEGNDSEPFDDDDHDHNHE